jgi:hypothetical protein
MFVAGSFQLAGGPEVGEVDAAPSRAFAEASSPARPNASEVMTDRRILGVKFYTMCELVLMSVSDSKWNGRIWR